MTYNEKLAAFSVYADQYGVLLDAHEAAPTPQTYALANAYYTQPYHPELLLIQAAYSTEQAAYDAAALDREQKIAAKAQYDTDLATEIENCKAQFFYSLNDMESVCFAPDWAGPTGYWQNFWTWLLDSNAPYALLANQNSIRLKMQRGGCVLNNWDNHCARTLSIEALRRNPPAAIPEAPESPVPPQVLPPPTPVEEPVVPAHYLVDTTGYTIVATGQRVAIAGSPPRVLNAIWNKMAPGEIADVACGDYARMDVRGVASRPTGGAPITLRGVKDGSGKRPKILRNVPPSGGSNAIFFGPGCADVTFEHFDIEADDTAGIMTANSPMPNFTFRDCRIYGLFDPVGGTGYNDDSKWGALLWKHSNWLFEDCEISGIRQEHAQYGHNRQGPLTWRRVKTWHCQRTAFQDVSRPGEGPVGKGDVLIEDCEAQDVCLESGGGGSAITCRGGNPSANWVIRRTTVRLGCDPALKAPYNENITGSVVFDNGSGGAYGGTKSVLFDDCDFEVGTVYNGQNNAKRSNVRLEVLESAVIRNTRIAGGTNGILLEIGASVPSVRFEGVNQIAGKILFHGTPYANLDALRTARPDLFA